MVKMEYQPEEKEIKDTLLKAAEISTDESPEVMRRTPRILHESSFATSAFTSSRSLKRPPGFVASSLDFTARTAGVMDISNDVTIKPRRNKRHNNKQQEEHLEREKQYKQRRNHRSGHPTRAQGNFGPPPHAIESLKDLENMSEEEIYKLFTEDPKFRQAILEQTEKVKNGKKSVPSSAPAGAREGRRSTGRKPSNSSRKSRQRNSNNMLNSKDIEREVPYLQWLFLSILISAATYKIFKFGGTQISKKAFGGISKNSIRRKQRSKKGKKPGKKTSTRKNAMNDNAKPKMSAINDGVNVKKKSSSKRKKKKTKGATIGSEFRSSEPGKEKQNDVENIEKEQPLANPETTDESSRNNRAEKSESPKAKFDTSHESSRNNRAEKAELDLNTEIKPKIFQISTENDGSWKTVTKTSKEMRKGKKTFPVEERKVSEQSIVQNMKDDGDAVSEISGKELNGDTSSAAIEGETSGKNDIASDENESTTITQTITATRNGTEHASVVDKTTSEVEDSDKIYINMKRKTSTSTENDAILALQLHEEEVNLARAANDNREAEKWEEVTIKKRKA